ncbi:hypothetical protein [Sphingopyxis flava]|uniref:Uncharacterized protein n=1 Tax=Sphingopyxis flava TaxID=1507287 RepID=A0A1T5FHY0_9SPHN|nr:hypothetical protein [Sphingopyxis flava]SKB95765.1 hypothetical protein SAMN06295937_103612 [Sphingopyxis flava]
MIVRRLALMLGAAALMQPPVAAEALVLTLPACGGPLHRMIVPGDPGDPKQRRDCAKACHAFSERRGKGSRVKDCC